MPKTAPAARRTARATRPAVAPASGLAPSAASGPSKPALAPASGPVSYAGAPLAPYDVEAQASAAEQLIDEIATYTLDPRAYLDFAWDWGHGELNLAPGPRQWQADVADQITRHLSDPKTRFQPCQVSVASGHGIGKSAFIGMLVNWAMSTCEDCKVVLTANTDTQIRTKTWPELSKWFRLAINAHWFDVTATSVKVRDPQHQSAWRCDAIPWNENNTEAFQGLHNQGKRILVVFDEGSGISDKIYEVTEGALTDENTEIIWLVFSNPTLNTGRFKECFGKLKHRWYHYQIDSRTVPGTNKAQIDKWAEDYGDDSDWFRIRVKGEFPRAGSTQLISNDLVAAARKTIAQGYASLPKVLSVDVARFGDDQTVIGTRQGRRATICGKFRGLDVVQVGDKVIEYIGKERPDAIVIDGDGIGGGVVDVLRHRGYSDRLFEFHGGSAANDAAKYFNRRAEVWGLMAEWFKPGVEVPNDPELESDLCGPQYGFSAKQQIQLEKKDDMKKRGLSSPDIGDMLAMTFSVTVAAPLPKAVTRFVYPGQLNQSWMQ